MTILLAHFLLLSWLSFAAARRLAPGLIDRIIATAMLLWGNIVVTSLALSCFGKLGEIDWFFRGSLLLGAITFWLVARFAGPVPVAVASPEKENRNLWLILATFGSLALILFANLAIAVAYEPNNYDSLTYHLPRVMYYLGQNSLANFETADFRQTLYPFNFNLLQLFALIYGAPLQAVTFFNVFAWVIAGLGVYRISRLCGCSFNASLAATWLSLTATQVLAQATSTILDLPTATALLGAVVFGLRWRQTGKTGDALLAGLAAGLSAGTKLTVVFFGPALVLLALVFWYQHWRRSATRSFVSSIRRWLVPGLLAVAICSPFVFYNLAATGEPMTHKMDFTLNKPFSFGCAWQTGKGYLVQLFVEPLCRFSFDTDRISAMNQWFSRNIFKNWNENHAFSPLYVFPPDVNEDHVWFGFAGPLFLICAIICLWRDRKLLGPLAWLSFLGLGWLLTYFAMNKWSLYIQRYFIPPILLMGPCVAAVLDAGKTGHRLFAGAKRLAFYAVAATALWFSFDYLLFNNIRPAPFAFTRKIAPRILPDMPPLLLERLAAQARINIDSFGTNERIFPLMHLGPNQRFTSGQRIDPDRYNVFSFWGNTRNNIYSNLGYYASYTLVPVPTKRTAGVEFLGTVEDTADSFDYVGLSVRANDTPANSRNRNLAVVVEYEAATESPTRLENGRLRVIGLNPHDAAQIKIGVELADGTTLPLQTMSQSGFARISITKPFKRLVFEVVDTTDGQTIGQGEMPFTAKVSEAAPAPPLSSATLFATELISGEAARNLSVSGLASLEGPYSQWDLPRFRWAKQPTIRITVPANSQLKQIRLTYSLRLQVRERANLEVLHNGAVVQDFVLQGREEWHTKAVEVTAAPGENVFELRDHSHDVATPDWLAYLEQNADVKNSVLAQGLPLEEGAKHHYETHGRAEHRVLPMQPNANLALPPADSLYFVFRRLRVEGIAPR